MSTHRLGWPIAAADTATVSRYVQLVLSDGALRQLATKVLAPIDNFIYRTREL